MIKGGGVEWWTWQVVVFEVQWAEGEREGC